MMKSIVFLLFSVNLFAQSTNNQGISGVVQDSTGSVVAGATVTALSIGTDLSRSAKSNESGNFVISNLPIGKYNISGEAPGFKKYVLTNVELTVDAQLTVTLKLEIGALTDSITIQADVAAVETHTGEVGRLISGQEATQLQLNGRNFPQLLALVPGVSTTYSSGFGLFGGYGVNNSGQSANGGRTDTFSWNLDGADNKDNGGGGNNFVNINPDAIAEFKMLTTNYSAEYGNSAGAVVNLALKSGSKELHGIAYEYFRNDDIQARAFNATSKPELRFNNFGWNVGGPIFIPHFFNRNREKLFFFVGEDFKRLRQGDQHVAGTHAGSDRRAISRRFLLPPGQKTRTPERCFPAALSRPTALARTVSVSSKTILLPISMAPAATMCSTLSRRSTPTSTSTKSTTT
jgi:hypothetical protein